MLLGFLTDYFSFTLSVRAFDDRRAGYLPFWDGVVDNSYPCSLGFCSSFADISCFYSSCPDIAAASAWAFAAAVRLPWIRTSPS